MFKVEAYQDAPAPPMTPELREACKRAIHVVKNDGEILRAGRATMFVLHKLNIGFGLPRLLAQPPLVWFVEIGYTVVARNRPFFSRFLFTKEKDTR